MREGVVLEVDSTVEDVSIKCMVEEFFTVALITGPMKQISLTVNNNTFIHNVRSIKCNSYTRLKKLKIVKLKKFKPNVFGCLPSSGLKMTISTHAYISYVIPVGKSLDIEEITYLFKLGRNCRIISPSTLPRL